MTSSISFGLCPLFFSVMLFARTSLASPFDVWVCKGCCNRHLTITVPLGVPFSETVNIDRFSSTVGPPVDFVFTIFDSPMAVTAVSWRESCGSDLGCKFFKLHSPTSGLQVGVSILLPSLLSFHLSPLDELNLSCNCPLAGLLCVERDHISRIQTDSRRDLSHMQKNIFLICPKRVANKSKSLLCVEEFNSTFDSCRIHKLSPPVGCLWQG